MAHFPSTRYESYYEIRSGGQVRTNHRLVDTHTVVLDRNDFDCVKALYCGRVNNTAGKVARVILWTTTGAFIGAPVGGIGAGAGAVIGLSIGFCTIL